MRKETQKMDLMHELWECFLFFSVKTKSVKTKKQKALLEDREQLRNSWFHCQ